MVEWDRDDGETRQLVVNPGRGTAASVARQSFADTSGVAPGLTLRRCHRRATSTRIAPVSRGRPRARWYGPLSVRLGLATAASVACSCTSSVTPPVDPVDPVSVWIVEDARHRGLILPAGDGYAEYGYGEWRWYAHLEDGAFDACRAALWPSRGALGRRITRAADEAALRRAHHWQTLTALEVERARVEELHASLEQVFEAAAGEVHENVEYGLTFVPYEQDFCIAHNCADEVAVWLRSLGCSVSCRPIRLDLEVAGDGNGRWQRRGRGRGREVGSRLRRPGSVPSI